MDYKILIVKNRYNKILNLNKYLVDWFKINTPLNIILEEISTDFDVITRHITNGTFTGVVVDEEIISKLKPLIPENKYNAVLFIYGNNLNGIRLSTCNGSVYADTEFIQTYVDDDYGKTANHELFHAFFQKTRKLQINLQDPMDTYIQNYNMLVDGTIDTNREMSLQLLKPYWDKICAFRKPTTPIINTKPITPVINTWKYFKLTERTGKLGHTVADLNKDLVDKLDKIRGLCGFPFIITSGYRTSAENIKVGGVNGSAHTKRLAVDILCTDASKRMTIVGNAWNNGFIGIGINKDYIHLDLDSTNNRRIWLY